MPLLVPVKSWISHCFLVSCTNNWRPSATWPQLSGNALHRNQVTHTCRGAARARVSCSKKKNHLKGVSTQPGVPIPKVTHRNGEQALFFRFIQRAQAPPCQAGHRQTRPGVPRHIQPPGWTAIIEVTLLARNAVRETCLPPSMPATPTSTPVFSPSPTGLYTPVAHLLAEQR